MNDEYDGVDGHGKRESSIYHMIVIDIMSTEIIRQDIVWNAFIICLEKVVMFSMMRRVCSRNTCFILFAQI